MVKLQFGWRNTIGIFIAICFSKKSQINIAMPNLVKEHLRSRMIACGQIFEDKWIEKSAQKGIR